MKRIAMVLVIAMLTVASVFSASNLVESAEAKVSFNLKHEDIASYRVGFTTKTDINNNSTWTTDKGVNMDDHPTNRSEIVLAFNDVESIGYNYDYYIYFKARGTKNVTLELSATPLMEGETRSIDYTVKVGDSNDLVDTKTKKSWTSPSIAMDKATNTKTDTYPIKINTYTVNASNIGDYTSTMTLKIASV